MPLRFLPWFFAALLLTGCRADPDLTADPEVPVPAPTPYSLTVPRALFIGARVPADNPLTNEGVALGRFLFYEKQLSADNTLSCGSCHQQARAFTDGQPLAVGLNGARHPRNTMSLANVMWVQHLNWDGRFGRLEDQNRMPIENHVEMGQPLAVGVRKLQNNGRYPVLFQRAFGTRTITEELVLKALAQFQRTLISADSRFDAYLRTRTGFTPQEALGMRLFGQHPYRADEQYPGSPAVRGANCGDCHTPSGLFMPNSATNNALDAVLTDAGRGAVTGLATDQGKFFIPTLRNIALTAPYMHDGRFATLEDVVDHYNDHLALTSPNADPQLQAANDGPGPGLHLTNDEKAALVAFLKTLTDTAFVQNPTFADPFR